MLGISIGVADPGAIFSRIGAFAIRGVIHNQCDANMICRNDCVGLRASAWKVPTLDVPRLLMEVDINSSLKTVKKTVNPTRHDSSRNLTVKK
ncbi:MAG: hypothetical protein Q7U49_14950 [Rhodoferax sp.]|uniref:hypothetical protein n=1 Tax=Rhodoferax sp. TaxID=50421 RepID=UPI0027177CFE|nr:hypothetical protein [Rhodoferax sp.]MDO9145583.1 hypothetical protein [Rhodoferax sp.]